MEINKKILETMEMNALRRLKRISWVGWVKNEIVKQRMWVEGSITDDFNKKQLILYERVYGWISKISNGVGTTRKKKKNEKRKTQNDLASSNKKSLEFKECARIQGRPQEREKAYFRINKKKDQWPKLELRWHVYFIKEQKKNSAIRWFF